MRKAPKGSPLDPLDVQINHIIARVRARVVESADTLGLEPSAARHGGSTPSLGTI